MCVYNVETRNTSQKYFLFLLAYFTGDITPNIFFPMIDKLTLRSNPIHSQSLITFFSFVCTHCTQLLVCRVTIPTCTIIHLIVQHCIVVYEAHLSAQNIQTPIVELQVKYAGGRARLILMPPCCFMVRQLGKDDQFAQCCC